MHLLRSTHLWADDEDIVRPVLFLRIDQVGLEIVTAACGIP